MIDWQALAIDGICELILATGQRLSGHLTVADDGAWWQLATDHGLVVINAEMVVAVATPGALPGLESAPAPAAAAAVPAKAKKKRSSGSPGRAWNDDELRLLADAFLDGAVDKDLSREFGRTPAIIKQLRQGFECARGNLVEDQISEIAASWVHRWRRVLTPA